MTIEQKAREIALIVAEDGGVSWSQEPYAAARLGIIEGLEMAAKVADRHTYPSALVTSEGKAKDIAKAIRALIEEQKV
ncbi:hypothetical protein Pam1_26 [Pseudanabaena phage Pam1]|nr:hypothetical protein Pam1_26 [Pseudanabaena phage Pam1]